MQTLHSSNSSNGPSTDLEVSQSTSTPIVQMIVADQDTVLGELEACSFRNKTPAETAAHITPLLQKWLPLHSNTSRSEGAQDEILQMERRKDHYSHFILRLAFSSTEELRRRFARIESALFRLRFQNEDTRERQGFVESLQLDWEAVGEEERKTLGDVLMSATPGLRRQEVDEGGWFKVDWEIVPELVESRRVFLKAGKAYVPAREQMSMVLAEFNSRLDRGLQVCKPDLIAPFNLTATTACSARSSPS